ncbi:class I SAM-dependent methyltransferase [Rathayibacter iranicus]|uniref:Methyltransferase domain-containing protein n=2 Tax=Rathayibacter iranicus TaxID=59737 RepID=A0AAD1EM78_9MICO|nr:class I SAM-dependent methyltransferase [Rathayibacter iranicus]AZZ55425.1 methyltransferase domain-containing protein [Rathayibacter iranicus]MWV30834.1 methyltransferase [Rathayibacter iranicus NCPPB 2253 = VKM Ac-1602]PPI48213.1 SAM-dependent methyltransferase [Rathayibacter iranicus]PPI61429.1 SAM-dependent methyltransferase [Rathayibacter iranicus]PPI72627.1 SAM-dependent methyltransferase [Rathayibacter iranicus]
MREDVLALIRRRPDVESSALVAVDASDRLLLDLAPASGRIAVVGDAYGALSLALAAEGYPVRVVQDSITAERALALNTEAVRASGVELVPIDIVESVAQAVRDADAVLLRLPRSLDALAAIAAEVVFANPAATLIGAGRIKHMTRAMNDILGVRYERIDVSLARQKSRALLARHARVQQPLAPALERRHLDELALTVVAVPGVFAGARLDLGTRALLDALDLGSLPAGTALDLGCGTGILATVLARARPDIAVTATDSSRIAVESARATAAANGVALHVLRDDNASTLAPGSMDTVLCNPPFHSDGAVTDLVARRMLRAAGRVLCPGGALWTVFNSHLAHPAELRRAIGPTTVMARDRRFTVTRSLRE